MSLIPVTELKQWAYCPRVVYYHRVMPSAGRMTAKMEKALGAQDVIERLDRRRNLKEYGWEGARRRFNLWLSKEELGLSGRLDLLLEREGQAAVVDFKLTSGEPGDNHRMQLTGYALLVEAGLGPSTRQGFIYRIPDDRIFAVDLGEDWRARVVQTVARIRELEGSQSCPEPTSVRKRCEDCEYANFCGDVW